VMAHGGGGRLMQQLLEQVFLPRFSNQALDARHDGATLPVSGIRLAFTTDSFVVSPLVFPGGTIADLAVNGTVNDLAMCGAEPLALSAAFIIEEGFELDSLTAIAEQMQQAARRAGVQIVTGDTKVVERGKGDGLFITTSGVGIVRENVDIGPQRVQLGDSVITSGDLGSHGIAVLSVREGLQFESPIVSDTAPLWEPVHALMAAGIDVHCLRDLTRGGLASALNEIAASGKLSIHIREKEVPVLPAVQGACELLGIDPLYVANEGRFVAFVPAGQAEKALNSLRQCEVSSGAAVIGTVADGAAGTVILQSRIGGRRVLDMLSGEQLPRIC
jgi:hydrogenase expression/formation protein HypE